MIPTVIERPTMLDQACASVLQQTNRDWVCYVASTDPVHLPSHPQFLRVEGRPGHAANRNALLDHWATTDHTHAIWLDDDDTMHPQRIERQLAAMGDADALYSYLVYSRYTDKNIARRHRGCPVRTVAPERYDDDLFGAGWHDNQNHATLMMTRQVLDCPRYCEEIGSGGADMLWLYEMFRHGVRFGVLRKVLYYYRLHDANRSNPGHRQSQPDYLHDLAIMRERVESYG